MTTKQSYGETGALPHPRGSADQDQYGDQYILGELGEATTANWYQEMGYEILDTRFRCARGEIDIIARASDGTVVFAEVKTRRGMSFGAAEAVTQRKVQRMRRAATMWLADKPYSRVRFDVVEVLFDGAEFTSRMYQGVENGAC